jgi:hypothetical protein
VELTQVVAAAETQASERVALAVQSKATWGTRLSWMAIGGLASVLVALVWSGALSPPGESNRGLSERQIALAAAWSEARTELFSGPAIDSAGDDAWPATSDPSSVEAAAEAPSWMTAAVFSLAGRSPDDGTPAEPFTNERGEN